MPSTGTLAPAVEKLVSKILTQVTSEDKYSVDDYYQMIRRSTDVAAALMVRLSISLKFLGEYQNPEPTLQEFVLKNLEQMQGSFALNVAQMLSAKPYGWSFTEKVFRLKGRQWYLDRLQLVDPRRYVFEGSLGKIEQLRYRPTGGGEDIIMPYEDGIHLINEEFLTLGGNPYGIPMCKRAYLYYEAMKIVFGALLFASQRQAAPIIYGKTNTNETTVFLNADGTAMLNSSTGEPIEVYRGYSLKQALKDIENSSVLVIDIAEELDVLQQQTNGVFLLNLVEYLQEMIHLSFLAPQTVLSAATRGRAGGDSNLNQGHRQTLEDIARLDMANTKEVLLEKVIRPLIEYNFGEQEDYGSFPDPEEPEDAPKLLDAIASSAEAQIFGEIDEHVVNRARTLANIHLPIYLP